MRFLLSSILWIGDRFLFGISRSYECEGIDGLRSERGSKILCESICGFVL